MSEFQDVYGNDIIKFKQLWRGLLDSKMDSKKTSDDETPISAMFEAEKIIRSVGSRRMTLDQATKAYLKIAPQIKNTDNKSYIAKIFASEESTRVPAKQILNDQLSNRETKLREAIQRQPNFLDPDEGDELLRDLANQAVVELGDRFGDLEWENIDELDKMVDDLTRKYSLSSKALNILLLNKQLMDAETFEQQQKKYQEMHRELLNQDKRAEADVLMEEMISLGVANKDGTPIKDGKKVPKSGIKYIWERLNR